jgi:AraC-like DNA-binding protein
MISHFIIISIIFLVVKVFFKADLGDYFIGIYISFLILLTGFRVMYNSNYFDRSTSFLDVSISKYLKSSLTEGSKQRILDRIILEFEINHYYSNNLASLSELAKKTGESPHHVSQVINEKLNKGFFELLAWYRIEEAKRIISDDHESKLTVEEVSEMAGNITLLNWLNKFAHPFLANHVFKLKTGNYANEEFDHGDAGIIQGYYKVFRTNDLSIILEKLKFITGTKSLGRNEPCFCSSGKKYKHCFLIYPKKHSPGIPISILESDLNQILSHIRK